MKTAEIKDLAIINTKELQKRIDELNKALDKTIDELAELEDSMDGELIDGLESDKSSQEGAIAAMQELQQSLYPLEPIVEKAFNFGKESNKSNGCSANNTDKLCYCKKDSDCQYNTYPTLQDFLNKPIELK